MDSTDKKDLLGEIGKFFKGAFEEAGKAIGKAVKALGETVKGLADALKELVELIGDLWEAYGRFAKIVRTIEEDNLVGRASNLLREAEKKFARYTREIDQIVNSLVELKQTMGDVKAKSKGYMEGMTAPFRSGFRKLKR